MLRTKYFKKFLFSGTTAVYAASPDPPPPKTPTPGGVKAVEGDKKKGDTQIQPKSTTPAQIQPKSTTPALPDCKETPSGDCDPCTGKLVRPTDLPIYEQYPQQQPGKKTEEPPSKLEEGIGAVRKEVWVWQDKISGYREKVKDVFYTGKEHMTVFIERLRADELPVPRAGAVALSGLAGFVFGLRGGWFKRIFYGTTCAGIMAAICYPQEAKEVTQDTIATGKKVAQITYNFITGVKPEGFKLPSPSQLLGSSIEVPGLGGAEKKPSLPAVSEREKEPPAILPPKQNDQSSPVDKDLYTNRR